MRELYKIFLDHPTISTDTRNIAPNSLFFALRGVTFDGNKFAMAALEQGAARCVVDDAEVAAQDDRMILVDDTLETMQLLAREHRRALGIKILAITGSNGKTTTKELLAAVLSRKYRLFATRGNLNNHIGVPLTLLSMNAETEFGVVEMGASSCGEIALLASIAEPNFGIVTNIGRAHLEGFGGADGVRRGKGELADWLLEHGGELFVATENPEIVKMAEERTGVHTIPYSYSLADGVPHNLEGDFNRFNVAAAVAVGERLGVDKEQIISAIAAYIPTNNRSQRVEHPLNTLLLDCYNANPSSMELSLANFISEKLTHRAAKVVILGDMLELGEWSSLEHTRVISQALASDIEQIILVGENFAAAAAKSNDPRIKCFAERKALENHLTQHPITNRSILIKGSHSIGLERVAERLSF